MWEPLADMDTAEPVDIGCAAVRQEGERHLAEALAGWAWSFPDVVVERLILWERDVAYTLDRASRRSRLLVAGAGRTGRFAELLYGSLAVASPRYVACPVLLVPSTWHHPLTRTPTESVAAAAHS
jgi:hypothetical protein